MIGVAWILFLQPIESRAQSTSSCEDVFDFVSNEQTFALKMNADKRVIQAMEFLEKEITEKIKRMTFSDMIKEVDGSIQGFLQADGYLPGTTPQRTPHSAQELIQDFQVSIERQSILNQINRNLAQVFEISLYLKSLQEPFGSEEFALLQLWEKQIWHYSIFHSFELQLIGRCQTGLLTCA